MHALFACCLLPKPNNYCNKFNELCTENSLAMTSFPSYVNKAPKKVDRRQMRSIWIDRLSIGQSHFKKRWIFLLLHMRQIILVAKSERFTKKSMNGNQPLKATVIITVFAKVAHTTHNTQEVHGTANNTELSFV